jgi:hypothetical protein
MPYYNNFCLDWVGGESGDVDVWRWLELRKLEMKPC